MFISLFAGLFFIFYSLWFLNTGKIDVDKNSRVFSLFVVFIVLQVLRIYYQNYFLDIPDYQQMFYKIKPLSQIYDRSIIHYYSNTEFDKTEVGFLFLISFFRLFSNSFQLFLFVISIFQFVAFYHFCKKMKICYYVAIPVYFSLTYIAFQIGMLRQAIAFIFLLYAIINIDRKFIFFIVLLLGVLFHNSIIICLLLFWVNKHINIKYIYILFLASLFVYLIQFDAISKIWEVLGLENVGRVEFYLGVDRENNYLGVGFWERVLFFIYMCYFEFKQRSKRVENKVLIVLFNLGVFSIVFQLLFFGSPTITSRLRYYVVIFPALYIFEYIRSYVKRKDKLLYAVPVFLYLLIYCLYQSSYIIGLGAE